MRNEAERAGSNMEDLSRFEHAVLAMFVAGDDVRLRALSKQLTLCRVKSREFTGAGFYTELAVPSAAPMAPIDIGMGHLSDVDATLDTLKHGAGFLLYVKEGRLHMLEGFTYDEPWPEIIGGFHLTYTGETRSLKGLEEGA